MLINKGIEPVTVKYNGKTRELIPGAGIDIRDFDVENKHVAGAEKHIMMKYPGQFEQRPNTGDPSVCKDHVEKINILEKKISLMEKELSDTKASEKIAQEKFSSSVGEIEGAKQALASMKKEVDKYKAENDELEHEISQLRLKVATGKK